MGNSKKKVFLPFSNPIFLTEITYDDDFRNSLIGECIKYRNEMKAINEIAFDRQVGWQSEKILFQVKEPYLKRVANIIDEAVWSAVRSISPSIDLSKYALGREGWLNVNEKGSLHFPHIHAGSSFSGVFYVKVPNIKQTDEKDIRKPGFIEFLDPRNDVSSFAKSISELMDTATFTNNLLLEPKEGTLLVFPAWLKHWVYPNNVSEERISISFNSWLIDINLIPKEAKKNNGIE